MPDSSNGYLKKYTNSCENISQNLGLCECLRRVCITGCSDPHSPDMGHLNFGPIFNDDFFPRLFGEINRCQRRSHVKRNAVPLSNDGDLKDEDRRS